MERERRASILYYISSVCFFVAGFSTYLEKGKTPMTFVWLGLGTAMFYLGRAFSKKARDKENHD